MSFSILGPLFPPFGEYLQQQTSTHHRPRQSSSLRMEAISVRDTEAEAVPLRSLEPRPTQQEPFPAIEEGGTEPQVSVEQKKSHAPFKAFCNFCRIAAEGNLFWNAVEKEPCRRPRAPSEVPEHARRRSSLARANNLERLREEQEKRERGSSNASSAARTRPRRLSRLSFGQRPRPRAPPAHKTLDSVIREEAQQGHGLLHASAKFDEQVRSCHNSRRNSAEDLAVVEETPEQQQPEDRKVEKAQSTGHVAPAVAAAGNRAKREAEIEEKILKDGDSGYDSQRASGSQRGSGTQPGSKLARMAKRVSPASSRYSQSSSLGRQPTTGADAACAAVSDAGDSCAVEAGDSCCDAGPAC